MGQETNQEMSRQRGEGFIPFSAIPEPIETSFQDKWIISEFQQVGTLGFVRFRGLHYNDINYYSDDTLACTIDQDGKKHLANAKELCSQGCYEIDAVDLFTVLPDEAIRKTQVNVWIENGDKLADGTFEYWEPEIGYDEPEKLREQIPNYDLIPGHENMRWDMTILTEDIETSNGAESVDFMLPLEMFPRLRFSFSKVQGGDN